MERSMIDVASGGAILDKNPTTIRHLIFDMKKNTQQLSSKNSNRECVTHKLLIMKI